MWLTQTIPAWRRLTMRSDLQVSRRPPPAARDRRLLLPDPLIAHDTLHLLAGDDGPHLRVPVEAAPELDPLGLLDHGVEHLLIDGLLHEDAAPRRAQPPL